MHYVWCVRTENYGTTKLYRETFDDRFDAVHKYDRRSEGQTDGQTDGRTELT